MKRSVFLEYQNLDKFRYSAWEIATKRLILSVLLVGILAVPGDAVSDIYTEYDFVFAVVKYGGGGDWYNGITGVRNLIKQIKQRTDIRIAPEEKIVSILDDDLFLYPFIFINGHGNIKLSEEEVNRLRKYLQNGGFLFCNDDYGLEKSFKREMKKVFPKKKLIEIPFSHFIYHGFYNFSKGLPKIHEHYSGPSKGLGIFYQNRLVIFFAYNSDIGDGWEKKKVFNDPEEKRENAIRMGINIVYYSLMY